MEPSQKWHSSGSGSGALGFHECVSGSGALILHGSGSSSGFCCFSHIKILIVLVCLKLNGKGLNQVHKIMRYTKHFWVIYSGSFSQASLLRWGNQRKKIQSQVQMIQRTVSSRNATQDNGNINIFRKAVASFVVNAWGPFVIYNDQNQENGCLKNYICAEHLNADQSQLTKCFALPACFACCSFGNSSQQLYTMQRAQNT